MVELILPAGTKMQRLRAVLGTISELDFCVLFAMYDAADRSTGLCAISHDELAAAVNRDRRTVERSTARLEKRGCEVPVRRRIGQRRMGDALYGGRGGKNVYNLIPERPSIGTVNETERPSGVTHKDRQARRERPSGVPHKGRQTGRDTVYTLESQKNPVERAQARDNVTDADPLQISWWAIKERLAQSEQWGDDKTEAWLGKLAIRELSAGILTLVAPTKFIANYNMMHHSEALLGEWRGHDPSITRLQIEWVEQSRVREI